MTRAQILRARRRAHHYDTPARILAELHRIGERYFWPRMGRQLAGRGLLWPIRLIGIMDTWRNHEFTARRQLLQDGCSSAALWDMGRAILLRACEIAREARR